MRQFHLHTRQGVFYAQLITESGFRLSARSTGTRNRDEALMIVAGWLKDGLPARSGERRRAPEAAAALSEITRIIRRSDLDTGAAFVRRV